MQVRVPHQVQERGKNGKKDIMRDMVKRCMDCGWYVTGGVENNCIAPNRKIRCHNISVCALKEACDNFKEREDTKQE